jgi:hypothetical protein
MFRSTFGGDHRHHHSRRPQCVGQSVDRVTALGVGAVEREQIVIVEGQAVGSQFGQPLDGFDRIQCGTGRDSEWIACGPADGPQAEREFIGRLGNEDFGSGGFENGHVVSPVRDLLAETCRPVTRRWICSG